MVEYVACPSCGRTLFNLEEVLHQVREATKHLTGLDIAVMGCIVNGPGRNGRCRLRICGQATGLYLFVSGQGGNQESAGGPRCGGVDCFN